MPAILPLSAARELRRPNVCRAWFLRVCVNGVFSYYHNGQGTARVKVDGEVKEWSGVSDVWDEKFVGVDQITYPKFTIAAAFRITMVSVGRLFYRQVASNRNKYEGAKADMYFGIFNQESQKLKTPLVNLFPGRLTSPELIVEGVSIRQIVFNVVSDWETGRFPIGGRWSDGDFQRTRPLDKFFQWVGKKIKESWT